MRKSTRATTTIPGNGSSPRRTAGDVAEPIDAEGLEFREQFEKHGPLDDLVRRGAQQMLPAAMDADVDAFVAAHADRRDERGHRQVARNGRFPVRPLLPGAGSLEVSQPRVRE